MKISKGVLKALEEKLGESLAALSTVDFVSTEDPSVHVGDSTMEQAWQMSALPKDRSLLTKYGDSVVLNLYIYPDGELLVEVSAHFDPPIDRWEVIYQHIGTEEKLWPDRSTEDFISRCKELEKRNLEKLSKREEKA